MYRLSNIKNDILQRVISNEMAAGFLRTFGVTRAVEHLDIGDFGKGIIKYLLNTYSGRDRGRFSVSLVQRSPINWTV